MHIFSTKIQELVPHNGFIYTNTEFDLNIQKGIQTKNTCSYALKVEDQDLGELTLMRHTRFSKHEIDLLETLLCCLIYPLRNATLFNGALKMAFTDALTQTNNRTAFNDSLIREMTLAERHANHLSLIFVDLDHFKAINDTYGHHCGDQVLKSAAQSIKDSIRGCDIAYRYGGEEFVILLSDTDLEGAKLLAERIREKIANHTLAYGMEVIKLTASLGVSSLRGNDTVDSFVQRADDAMYQAKEMGRNRVQAAA
ncbi:GGDEF domain-containing protein [methanotrophic endosymbiont of Bathymodiolus puteoserpentis (Logatchev)]|uniref:GGDEF domain-containing protein n=1 Tax=methanotrophic endosymbiont of Bathymodiolus puteoserpentis (Logatchev) TaxID=343235 RepID=UPI0013CC38DF|nr:GGDEF domain-containing protein [methanotrophic endosymbiont of Bathymodiolus puteoserpentis (Logatchev)]SHE22369.1 diguanylate cyclase/phosphodiesterase (GGDEF & EAL domains) with PAS/PAC sensor(s) [methanotrophic endosymbiont of Bathymodiolus puteoserpentis (Logatchev)]